MNDMHTTKSMQSQAGMRAQTAPTKKAERLVSEHDMINGCEYGHDKHMHNRKARTTMKKGG